MYIKLWTNAFGWKLSGSALQGRSDSDMMHSYHRCRTSPHHIVNINHISYIEIDYESKDYKCVVKNDCSEEYLINLPVHMLSRDVIANAWT